MNSTESASSKSENRAQGNVPKIAFVNVFFQKFLIKNKVTIVRIEIYVIISKKPKIISKLILFFINKIMQINYLRM